MAGEPPVTVAILGAGVRGRLTYGAYCLAHRQSVRVVAVAEPDEGRRDRLAGEHGIPESARYGDWSELLAHGPRTDGVIIATPDWAHAAPAAAALGLGRDVLVEKPVARTPDELALLLASARRSAGRMTISHPLRHAPFFETIARLVAEGRIGRLMTIDHVENVGYLHFAHSYVRGNWRRSGQTAPVILTKACHDLDVLAWLAGSAWTKVSSFGRLSHFRSDNAPPGAPKRCTDGCPVQSVCPFDAVAFYGALAKGHPWLMAATTDESDAGIQAALAGGPYGRCVYRCDNDVADHQVTAIDFADGLTATLTVTAFTSEVTRTLRLMGTAGEIGGNLTTGELTLRTFTPGLPAPAVRVPVDVSGDGHGGGDERLVGAFIAGLAAKRAGTRLPLEAGVVEASLIGHELAFAAEESRLRGQVIEAAPAVEAAHGV